MSKVIQIFEQLEHAKLQSKVFARLDKLYTYGQLLKTTKQLGSVFLSFDLTEGDRIVISSTNLFAIGSLTLACFRYGVTVTLIDPEVGIERAEVLINICKPDAIFIDSATLKNWQLSENTDLHVFEIHPEKKRTGSIFKKMFVAKTDQTTNKDASFLDALSEYEQADFPSTISTETVAYILFTSGTTQTSKAVQISHAALWSNLETIIDVYELDSESNILNILPMYHTDGVIQGPVLSAMIQGTWCHPLEFSVKNVPIIFDMLYKHKISHFITVPTMLAFLLKLSEGFEDSFNTDDFKYIVTSASPMEVELWKNFESRFNTIIVNNYGLTETVAGASYCGPKAETRKVGTIGKPVDCEFKIVDPDNNELGANEKGELLIRGTNTLSNYLNNEAATRNAIRDGWFYTGDVAIRDEEGFYTLVGRMSSLIISGGINIQPEEVSEVLNTFPNVTESVCIGVPDEVFGENLVACIVGEGEILESDLIEHCRRHLEPAKVPKKFYFLDELPKTGSGKIMVKDVKKHILGGKQESTSTNSDLEAALTQVASDIFGVPKGQLDLNSNTENVDGWDSMAHLMFITKLEDDFSVKLTSKDIMNISSLRDVKNILTKKMSV